MEIPGRDLHPVSFLRLGRVTIVTVLSQPLNAANWSRFGKAFSIRPGGSF